MNLKKILLFGVANIAILGSGMAYAGGPEVIAPACPACVSTFVPFAYLGVSAGWAYSDWFDFIVSSDEKTADTNGFAYGGKIGYQFSDLFGVEGGGFGLPRSNQSVNDVSGKVNSWIAYGAGTIRAPFPGHPWLHIMGKVGGVYRAVNHDGELYESIHSDDNYGTVLFGGTVEYDLVPYHWPLAVAVDYYYVPGSNDAWLSSNPIGLNEAAAPAAQIVVGTLTFKFAV